MPERLGENPINDIDRRLADFFATSKSRWPKLYAHNMKDSDAMREHVARKVKAREPILSHIRRYTPRNGRILESAAGTGTLSLQLSKEGFQCTTLEQDGDMIALSEMIQEICGGDAAKLQGTFLELPFHDDHFDTVFNHGVLEYFDDPTVVRIIKEQLRVGKRFIFGVPTILNRANYIEEDEVLRTYWRWKGLVEEAGGQIRDSYSYFSYRKVRAWINSVLGMQLQPFSPGVGFVVEKA